MDRRFRFKLPRGVVVGVLSSLGIASAILWCKLMGHTSGFYLPLVGLSTWANARVFWLVGIALAALACLVPVEKLSAEYILPYAFDEAVRPAVARAVAQAARDSGVARL